VVTSAFGARDGVVALVTRWLSVSLAIGAGCSSTVLTDGISSWSLGIVVVRTTSGAAQATVTGIDNGKCGAPTDAVVA
jgi:hypothetical protein